MDRVVAVIAAATITSFFAVVLTIIERYLSDGSGSDAGDALDFIMFTAFNALIYWIIGFLFSALLMIILGPIYKSTSPNTSRLLFIAIGFGVPFGLGCFAGSLGNPSGLEANLYGVMSQILVVSLIGATLAFIEWLVLRMRSANFRT